MDTEAMTFYNHIENVRTMAINLTNGEPWHGVIDKARVFDSLDASRREYTQLQEENAKLRKMVVTLMACVSVDDCDKCPINGAEFKASEVRCCYAAKQCMRELGIEAFLDGC